MTPPNATDCLTIDLGARSYDIEIGTGAIARLPVLMERFFAPQAHIGIVTSQTVQALYADRVDAILKGSPQRITWITLRDGEEAKNMRSIEAIYEALLPQGFSRKDGIIALGGGVVGDMAGFAAASLLRGVDYIQIPTTLLAMVDSSVGGKTGINHRAGKNLIGAFHQPKHVLVDLDFLDTLPNEELSAGLAEVAKYGVIWDSGFFELMEENAASFLEKDTAVIASAVRRSVEIKAEVVAQDERESGLRAVLNFGHTVGHAIEASTNYGDYRHGEAISIGMVAETILAEETGLLSDDKLRERLKNLLTAWRLPVKMPDLPWNELLHHMRADKKAQHGKLTFVLPAQLGKVEIVTDVAEAPVKKAIQVCSD